ncbi:MAG TPA: STAS domain-containing protein [Leptospiraceae bacterium]|nr:STAS domain-containing protein [Leptospiraceae bacterium]HMY65470.1 STAS domain-containing protein [Leptospiraceae bacterium]HNF17009.1 STAS domain-containing protein [Leptospiraceae bacterium]HNF27463.1 STAS domain-containing protein [Leptospiraceae bacterium]HNH09927.1 STAS domain-containing protein [Leptospiraceae bacterium]
MDIKIEKIGKHTLVKLAGRLDITQSDEVESALTKDIQSGEGDMIINLGQISYISSSGIRVFVGMVRELGRQGRKLKLCNITPPVKKVFDVVELLDLFDVYDNEDQAVASLS